MIQTNWHVITGAPSSGKTTLINHLASAGYATAPEVAREYINGLLAARYTLDDISYKSYQLQRGILAAALKRERHLPANQLIFLDRGTPDSLGYFRYYEINENHTERHCQRIRYKKLFYCHPLPMEYDSVRIENSQSAVQIGQFIYEAYSKLGYELIELPAISVQQRMDIILSHCNEPSPVNVQLMAST